ncbi:MAG TPA: type II toxin-antitoxin system MqsA family antitoxin [Methylomirabilota bacterium]|jgi:YgiT-type zinc finger domain-containing protein|nr:type II toxin-antitoxin system MqsA family antitoxin [Methylomirabilota bacterium]
MKCLFCKEGETQPQRVTVERHNQAGEPIAVIHNFPAEVCPVCGEEYYAAEDWQEIEHVLTRPPLRIAQVPVYELGSEPSPEA